MLHHHDQVAVAGGQVEVVQDHHHGAAALAVEPASPGRAPRPGGRGRGRSSARRAAPGRCPGPASSRSRRAAAARRRARRAPGRAGPRCRSAAAPRSTTSSSSGDHWRNQRWCGCRPRPTRSRTSRPSGAIGLWGSRASRRETSRVDTASMASPSSRTLPPLGLSSRARVRSRVDLPQPLGPTMVVTSAVGQVEGEVADDRLAAVPDGDALGAQAARCRRVLMRTSSGWCGSAARSGTARRSPR